MPVTPTPPGLLPRPLGAGAVRGDSHGESVSRRGPGNQIDTLFLILHCIFGIDALHARISDHVSRWPTEPPHSSRQKRVHFLPPDMRGASTGDRQPPARYGMNTSTYMQLARVSTASLVRTWSRVPIPPGGSSSSFIKPGCDVLHESGYRQMLRTTRFTLPASYAIARFTVTEDRMLVMHGGVVDIPVLHRIIIY